MNSFTDAHTRLDSEATAVERAATEYEAARAKLYRADGSKYYGDEEHNGRLAALLEPLQASRQAAVEARDDVLAVMPDLVAAARYSVPLSDVDGGDALAIRRDFIKEDAQELPLGELADVVTGVALRGTKIEQQLYQRYASRRLASEGVEAAGSRELSAALNRLPQRADTSEQQAAALREKAQRLAMDAGQRVRQATGERARSVFTF
jgi:hypothetical protein